MILRGFQIGTCMQDRECECVNYDRYNRGTLDCSPATIELTD